MTRKPGGLVWTASSSAAGGFCRGFCWLRSGYSLQKEPLPSDAVQCRASLKSRVTVGTWILGLGPEAGQQQNAAEDCFLQREDISSPLSLTPPFSDQGISPLWGLGSSFLTVLYREGLQA